MQLASSGYFSARLGRGGKTCGPTTAAQTSPLWSDLPDDLLASYGLTRENIGDMSNGYLDGTWRPYDNVTRGQFVSLALMYVQMNQLMAGLAEPHFSDVPRSAQNFLWVEAGFDAGLVQGYQTPSPSGRGVFGLYDPISREQVVTILGRYLSKMDPSRFDYSTYTAERSDELLAPFLDKEQVRRRQEVAMALDIGVLQPPGAALMPEANLTRTQAAALIVRTQNLLPPPQEPRCQDDGCHQEPPCVVSSSLGSRSILNLWHGVTLDVHAACARKGEARSANRPWARTLIPRPALPGTFLPLFVPASHPCRP